VIRGCHYEEYKFVALNLSTNIGDSPMGKYRDPLRIHAPVFKSYE